MAETTRIPRIDAAKTTLAAALTAAALTAAIIVILAVTADESYCFKKSKLNDAEW